MRQIKINSGRLLQRCVSDGEFLLGLIHLDPLQPIEEGADYLLVLENQHTLLLELPSDQRGKNNFQNASIDEILCSQNWRKTTNPNARIVRLLKQFDDSNGWLVFGPQQTSIESDRWFDVFHDQLSAIEAPCKTMGEKSLGLARTPIWPHPNGQLYTMVPNFPILRDTIAGITRFKILAHTHYGFAQILAFKFKYTQAFHSHRFWGQHPYSQDSTYDAYLHALNQVEPFEAEKPMSSTAHAAHLQKSQHVIATVFDQLPTPSTQVALTPTERTTVLMSSTDPIVCANAVFEAVLANDETVVNTPAWDLVCLDHIVLCMAPALKHNNETVIQKIAQTVAQSNVAGKEMILQQLARVAEQTDNTRAQEIVLQQYTPSALTSEWEIFAYNILPFNPRSLRHWVKIYDQVMFENVLAYTLNCQEREGKMTWEEKCLFIKDIIDGSGFKWGQNKVFNRASYVEPIPTFEQWDLLFNTLNVEPIAQKGLVRKAEKSFNDYFEHTIALKQKVALEDALNEQPIAAPLKKKM